MIWVMGEVVLKRVEVANGIGKGETTIDSLRSDGFEVGVEYRRVVGIILAKVRDITWPGFSQLSLGCLGGG
ncbi:hypothetical protein Tco_0230830 [Tanacetum coccineum]